MRYFISLIIFLIIILIDIIYVDIFFLRRHIIYSYNYIIYVNHIYSVIMLVILIIYI